MIRLHLGCGQRDFGPDWIHVDGADYPHIQHNDVINLPFDEDSVDLIYCSHLLEYFDREEAETVVLPNWFNVLKPGGVLRLAVPNFSVMADLYVKHGFRLDSFLGPLYGKMKMDDNVIYHKTVYDYVSLHDLLFRVGFADVKMYDWRATDHASIDDQSKAYLPHSDEAIRNQNFEGKTLISLNVEAVK